ncbi:MAG: HypC/HybG/HupF family hydrogenase formation chaperone [Candidatus Aenigmarchaeota archaeon]|nr:HypC/HybG/HupF family hydrogenase formation chaperone [Candidatus Aenigmarchaeota archaeon]
MCLAIPGKVIELKNETAIIDYGGITKEAKITLITPKIGDSVIVHAGFAIEILDKKKAQETNKLLENINDGK